MTTYTLKPDVVRDCLHRLIDEPVHRMFPGYLCLHQQAALEGKTTGLAFPYNEFFDDYLRVKAEGAKTPYFVPFTQATNASLESLWLNENVAGTYAPSSLRSTAPLLEIAEIEKRGHNSEWGLIDDHWKLARLELCSNTKLPVESLAAYLLRDYGFNVDDPSAFTVVKTFTEEFGYNLGDEAFSHLYRTGDSEITRDSFEKYE
ncbi:hypothetical protein V5735_19050 [Haladaptatus sp. SPP-AMP-3]|uniref:hypothetical protein n=1 Tax=Haladaptatus sp. SPP-AMP-3 TaxID=3121295 RepID=UPI003C2DEEAE